MIFLLFFHWLILLLSTDDFDEGYFQSARVGDVIKLKEYLANNINVNSHDSKGNSAIVIASGRGHVNIITILLEQGANVDDYTHIGLFEGKSALCWAASQGRTQESRT